MATKPLTGTVSARRVKSTSAAVASRAGSTANDLRLCRSIFRRWPNAAAATSSSARRSHGSGAPRGTNRTTDEVTLGCGTNAARSEEHTSELQSHLNLVCRLLLEKKKNITIIKYQIITLVSLVILP